MTDRPIGIFDSGFGGLTVMRAIRERLPHENIVYFGDTAHLPYGNKSPEAILRYSLDGASFLRAQKIKLLVNACNTSCCAALTQVRESLDIPVIGVSELAIEEVVSRFQTERIAILATKATIHSGIFQKEILSQRSSLQLHPIPCPLFVPLIEEGFISHPMSTLAIQEYLSPLKSLGIKAALLACTHYPLLLNAIQKQLGPEVHLIDPAEAVARKTQAVLAEQNLLNSSLKTPRYQFFVSEDVEKFRLLGETFLRLPIEDIRLRPDLEPQRPVPL